MEQSGRLCHEASGCVYLEVKMMKVRKVDMLNLNCTPSRRLGLLVLVSLCTTVMLPAQATLSTGAIRGIVSDQAGAVLAGAKVIITDRATARVIQVVTSSDGMYLSGPLQPGDYTVGIEAKGFKTAEFSIAAHVGVVSSGNVRLEPGQGLVPGAAMALNTEQATVQGVLNANQIENLPVNGRNFLDLAQLEPGVQIQDGTNFDPTKVGYSSISFGGRFGRSARIEVDGVDVSDETVGTTTEDIPASAIQEFSIAQSNLDLSNELTSSGAVNVVTKSGTNSYHGEAFGIFRDHGIGSASLPHAASLPSPYFQRNQEGASLGGPVLKDKLFFFGDGERTFQHLRTPVLESAPFSSYSGFFPAPFTDNEALGRLDYQLNKTERLFGRVTYFKNSTDATFFPGSFQVYNNRDIARNAMFGADFNTGSIAHSIRVSYLKFQNQIVDATIGTNLPFANYPVSININSFTVGPNSLAPQSTPQSDLQLKYDGSKAVGKHLVRFGAGWNRIQSGGFADFYGTTPNVFGNGMLYPGCAGGNASKCPLGPDGSTVSNPLDYEMVQAIISNGQGFSTEKSALGFPAGGLGPDNRLGLYVGDSWKIRPNITLSPGLRWVRDTGRTDSDLPAIAAINSAFPGMGNQVRQPNSNFAPQLGLAWDPSKNGKTVVRAGAGLFYENVIYNNVLFDRPLRLQNGAFLYAPSACLNSQAQAITTPGGALNNPSSNCVDSSGVPLPIFQAAQNIVALENSLKAAYPFTLSSPNGAYVGALMAAGINLPLGLFAPNYRTPRSLQMNIGIQHEIRHGMVLSLDFLRNVETHALLSIDANDVGDPRYFSLSSAQQAIQNTITACGASSLQGAITSCPGLNNGQANIGATISNFTAFGLGSAEDTGSSCMDAPNPLTKGSTRLGYACAFTGRNGNYGTAEFLQPVSRSVYNALQMKLVQNMANPMRGVRAANFQLSYSLSRFVNPVAFAGNTAPSNPVAANDQDFVLQAADNNNPLRFMGPSLLDRTHQVSFGGNFDVPFGFRLGIIGHFYSPLSSPAIVGSNGSGGQIFQTDFTGGGAYSQPLPGTKNGSFGREVSVTSMNEAISKYNTTIAGQPTPAGQVLISNNLFSAVQLAQIGAVAPQVSPVPADQLLFPWTKDLDVKVAWPHKFGERFTIEPSVVFYNVFNFSNFNQPPSVMSPWLTSNTGSINSTHTTLQPGESSLQSDLFRVGAGTGVFGLASPRVTEFALKITF
jgi:hypothetical protein